MDTQKLIDRQRELAEISKSRLEDKMKQDNILYLVSPHSEEMRYSGTPGQRLYKTLLAAEARVRKVKEITGKRYFISELEVEED